MASGPDTERPRDLRNPAILAALLTCVLACAQPAAFWIPGQHYQATFVAIDKPSLTAELRAVIGEPVDSVSGELIVQRVEGDSVFGVFEVDFLRMGLAVARVTPGPQLFAGTSRERRFEIRLVPDATDVGLIMVGTVTAGGANGSWDVVQGRGRGRFSVAPAQ